MEYQVQENCLTIYLPAEVDHHNAEEMKRKADKLIDRNHIKYVIFDFENTDFMDSSGIGVIMGRYKTISLIGGEVWAVHTNARIRKILTLSGTAISSDAACFSRISGITTVSAHASVIIISAGVSAFVVTAVIGISTVIIRFTAII